MSLKERLDKVFDVSSYGYKVNKWLFRSVFIIVLLLFVVVVRVDGWGVAVRGSQYVYCPADGPSCLNPYVDGVEPSYLLSGESVGVEPSVYARVAPYLCVGFFALAVLLNHLIYNRNFKVKKND